MPTLDAMLLARAADNDKAIALAERELAARYRASYDELAARLAKLYEQMGDTPSLAEARRYSRLAALQKAIADEYRKLTKISISTTQQTSAASFANAAYGARWAFDQEVGVELSWPVLSVEAIRASVWSSQTGEDFAERFQDWKQKDYIKMNQTITRGLALGQSYAKTARQLREGINRTAFEAMRIVQTESNRAYTQGHLETYGQAEEAGVQARKRWVATLDTKTRDTHATLDGEFADADGLFHSHGLTAEGPGLFGDPAEDINCRCRVVEEVEGFSPDLRRIRGQGIVPYQSFKTWAKPLGWSEAKGWPIEAKAKVSAAQAVKY